MRALSITYKDLQVFVRDRGALLMLFLLPFVFIVMLSLLGGDVEFVSSSDEKISLTVVNQNPQGDSALAFLQALEDTQLVDLVEGEKDDVEYQLNESMLSYALFIPEDFTSTLEAGGQTKLKLMLHPNYDQAVIMTLERALNRAAREYLMLVYLNKGLEQMGAMQAANPGADEAFSTQRINLQVEDQIANAAQRPLIVVTETTPVVEAEEDLVIPKFGQHIVVGMAVLFVFLGAQNTATSFFKEKRVGSFRRLLAAPISKSSLLIGKLLGSLVLCVIQVAVILITGGFIIQLLGVEPLDLGNDPIGIIVVSFVIALCATSLGIFIAAIAKTENQVSGVSSVLLFMAGLFAGSFVPLFLFPEGLENIARFIPHYWANQAYYGLIFRGQTLADIWTSIAALLVFTLIFYAIGLWRFKYE